MRHTPIFERASWRSANQFSFRHSSRSRPLKLSTNAFSIGLPGRMKWSWTPRAFVQASSARAGNAGPLSQTIMAGSGRVCAICSSTRTTRSPGSEVSTSVAIASRL